MPDKKIKKSGTLNKSGDLETVKSKASLHQGRKTHRPKYDQKQTLDTLESDVFGPAELTGDYDAGIKKFSNPFKSRTLSILQNKDAPKAFKIVNPKYGMGKPYVGDHSKTFMSFDKSKSRSNRSEKT